jgi:hypothetical protein
MTGSLHYNPCKQTNTFAGKAFIATKSSLMLSERSALSEHSQVSPSCCQARLTFQDVFIESITYLLVVCTDNKITLLGLSVNPTQSSTPTNPTPAKQELTLYQTDLNTSPDSVAMTQVVGTPSGRIFMTGINGCLYEVVYQAEASFFNAKKCSLTNWTAGRLSHFLPTILSTSNRRTSIS